MLHTLVLAGMQALQQTHLVEFIVPVTVYDRGDGSS